MYIKRPLCFICAVFALTIFLSVNLFPEAKNERYSDLEDKMITLTGKVYRKEFQIKRQTRVLVLYLDSVQFLELPNTSLVQLSGKNNQINKNQLIICTMKTTEEPLMGQQIRVKGKVYNFNIATNPGEFNTNQYYQILNTAFRLQESTWKTDNSIEMTRTVWDVLKETLYQMKSYMALLLDNCFEQRDAAIVKTMLLGDKSTLEKEQKTLYQESGIIHVMAISGLHISIIGMGIYHFLKRIMIPRVVAIPISMIFIILFGIMTGSGTSAIRAITMFIIHLIAEIVGRTYDMLTAMSVSLLFLLLEQPLYVKHSGFLLSFGAVCGIGIVLPALMSLQKDKENGNKRQHTIRTDRKYVINRLVQSMIRVMLPGLSITLVTLPILLYYYSTFPLYSLFLNLLVIPLMTIVLSDALLVVISAILFLPLGKICGILDHIILWFYETACLKTINLPGNTLIIGKPPAKAIICYYVLLIAALFLCSAHNDNKEEKNFKKNENTIPNFFKVQLLVIAFGIITTRYYPDFCGIELTFLDVGQGDCIYLRDEQGKSYLFDAGSTTKQDVGTYQVLPFLKARGVSRLEGIFLSHPDEDHINGVVALLQQSGPSGIKVRSIYLPVSLKVDIMKQEETGLEEIIQIARENEIAIRFVKKGDCFSDTNKRYLFQNINKSKLQILCLHPEEDFISVETNEISQVWYIKYGKFSTLLTGDITGRGETEMMQCLNQLSDGKSKSHLTVLKVAHHGSKNSTPVKLLNQLQPKIAVISSGEGNSYGHPHRELLDRLSQYNAQTLRTDQSGAITIHTDGEKMGIIMNNF